MNAGRVWLAAKKRKNEGKKRAEILSSWHLLLWCGVLGTMGMAVRSGSAVFVAGFVRAWCGRDARRSRQNVGAPSHELRPSWCGILYWERRFLIGSGRCVAGASSWYVMAFSVLEMRRGVLWRGFPEPVANRRSQYGGLHLSNKGVTGAGGLCEDGRLPHYEDDGGSFIFSFRLSGGGFRCGRRGNAADPV